MKYRIYKLSRVIAKDLTFSIDGGEEIGITDYFMNAYNT